MQASLSPFIALRCVPGIDIWLQTWAFRLRRPCGRCVDSKAVCLPIQICASPISVWFPFVIATCTTERELQITVVLVLLSVHPRNTHTQPPPKIYAQIALN